MEELKAVLLRHAARYPGLQPQDAVKLIYQSEFGGGHIISDAAASLTFLLEEAASLEADGALPLCEDIGNGVCRLHLAAAKAAGWPLPLINRLFVASANGIHGSAAAFERKLTALTALADEGALPFSAAALRGYLAPYRSAGCPVVRHSAPFREAYRPAYRVISRKYVDHLPLFGAIERLLDGGRAVVVAIDGRCGSGKTTLANLTAELYDCNVIRMDDFFLPPALRTEDRLAEAGGNIHYERFLEEVVAGLRGGGPFRYRVFDCSAMEFRGAPVMVTPRPLTIVEGSYSLHPLFASVYDLKVFLTCPPEEQRRRILKRSGLELWERFADEWIPMEERYFARYGVPGGCDLLFSNESGWSRGKKEEI